MDRRGNDRDVEDLSHFCVGRLLPTQAPTCLGKFSSTLWVGFTTLKTTDLRWATVTKKAVALFSSLSCIQSPVIVRQKTMQSLPTTFFTSGGELPEVSAVMWRWVQHFEGGPHTLLKWWDHSKKKKKSSQNETSAFIHDPSSEKA